MELCPKVKCVLVFGEIRRERLKSALYLRVKKRKIFFWEKIEIIENLFFFQKSRIVPKKVKGNLSGFINIRSVAKY